MERQHRKLGSKGYLILIKSANLDAELRGAENVAAVISGCPRIRMLVCWIWWMSACYYYKFYNVALVECVGKYILQKLCSDSRFLSGKKVCAHAQLRNIFEKRLLKLYRGCRSIMVLLYF